MDGEGNPIQQQPGVPGAPAVFQLTEVQLQTLMREAVVAAFANHPGLGQQQQQQQQQQQPPPPPTAAFALVPGAGTANVPWDYNSPLGLKLCLAVTHPLDKKFDGSPEALQYFLDAIQFRADTYGLGPVLSIETGTALAPEKRALTHEYGAITRAQMVAHAMVYQGNDDRLRQSARTIMVLITQSVTAELMDELKQRKEDYTVDAIINPNVNPPVSEPREDGPLMMYELIKLVAVNTKATVSGILRMLTGPVMCDTMQEVDSDIKQFNKKIHMLMVALRARRSEVPNIVPALFEAYQTCEDSAFCRYISRKEEEYEDNSIATLENNELMTTALEKFKTLTDKKVWKKKTKNELEFIALTALKSELLAAKRKMTQNPVPVGRDV